MEIRRANIDEIEAIMPIYDIARNYMRENGNMAQWIGYPSKQLIQEDIEIGQLYVCTEGSELLGVFAYNVAIDPCYVNIYDGEWLNDKAYGFLHRLAIKGSKKGVGGFCVNWAVEQCKNLKIDTHADNIPMQNMLKKNGFTSCGTVFMSDGTPRIAFQKCI